VLSLLIKNKKAKLKMNKKEIKNGRKTYRPVIRTNIEERIKELKEMQKLINTLKKKKLIIEMDGYSLDKPYLND